MEILVTGAAGFIGSHVAEALLKWGDTVIGLDNFNDYYDPARKRANFEEVQRNTQHTARSTFIEGDVRDLLHQAITIQEEIGYESSLAESLAYLAQVLAGLGRPDESVGHSPARTLAGARDWRPIQPGRGTPRPGTVAVGGWGDRASALLGR